MPLIRPFRGILYDPDVVGSLESVVAPPYDVIEKAEQERLYAASPYNVVRLDLGKERDRYAAACSRYHEWLERGALRQDPRPAYYAYAQRYRLEDGRELERWGFFARLRLEEFSSRKVLPHEKTLDAAKADRLELQRACRANLSSIFGIYSSRGWNLKDTLGPITEREPRIAIDDRSGVHHRFWPVVDEVIQRDLERGIGDRTIYIADGHHRYETALRYRNEMREATGRRGGEEPFDYVLGFLANMEEPGLTILPTHRLLRAMPIPHASLVAGLPALFDVDEVSRSAGAEAFLSMVHSPPAGERRIGVVLAGLDRRLVLRAHDGRNDWRLRGSTALRRLDVTLLHGLVLEGESSLLGLDAHEEAEAGRLVYVKDDREVLRAVESGEFAAGFLLNATRPEEVRAVCEEGETMPEKSTYFHPKLLTGLVFNSVED